VNDIKNKYEKCFTFQFIPLLLIICTQARSEDEEENYEPSDRACEKCNCTSVNGELNNGESGTLFTIDCSMKNVQHIFNKWPEEMDDTGDHGKSADFLLNQLFNEN
jgi:hypothetical protein